MRKPRNGGARVATKLFVVNECHNRWYRSYTEQKQIALKGEDRKDSCRL